MTAGALWDLSGQAAASRALPSGTKSSTGASDSSANSSSSGSTFQSATSIGTNTPSFGIDALHDLIGQLMGQPNISKPQLDKQAPLLVSTWVSPSVAGTTNGGWGYVDPLTGKQYTAGDPQVQTINNQRTAQRDQLTQAAGTSTPGTAYTQNLIKTHDALITGLNSDKNQFTRQQAFSDAGDLSSRFMRQLMEQLLPTINKAVDASGTSGGAVRGLLAQDAAQRVAESQAALGLDTAVKYGQISTQISSILDDLTKQQDPNLAALIQLLNVAKGTIDQKSSTASNVTSDNKSLDESKNTVETGSQQGTYPNFGATVGGAASVTPNTNSGVGIKSTAGIPLSDDQIQALLNLKSNATSSVASRENSFTGV